jgi:hypothetical protein
MDLIEQDTLFDKNDIQKYIIPGDGHPTTYFNTLISNEIKKAVLNNFDEYQAKLTRDSFILDTNYFTDRIRMNKEKIFMNDTVLRHVRTWAEQKNKSLEEMVDEFSVYLTFEGKDPYKVKY